MTHRDLTIMIIIGGIFVLLGIITYLLGRREESAYYSNIATKIDVREFMERLPFHPEPGALRTGGKIAIAVGVVVLLVAFGLNHWALP